MKCLGFPGKLCQEKLLVERAGNAPTHPWIHLPLQQLGQPRTRGTGEQQCHWGVPSGIAGMFGMPLSPGNGKSWGQDNNTAGVVLQLPGLQEQLPSSGCLSGRHKWHFWPPRKPWKRFPRNTEVFPKVLLRYFPRIY